MKYCDEYAALLDLYVDGELEAADMARVRDHLDICPGCQAYVDDALALRAAFPTAEETEVPDGFADNVMAAVRAAEKVPRKRRWRQLAVSLAACCAIVALVRGVGFQGGWKAESASPAMEAACTEAPASTEAADTASDSTGVQSLYGASYDNAMEIVEADREPEVPEPAMRFTGQNAPAEDAQQKAAPEEPAAAPQVTAADEPAAAPEELDAALESPEEAAAWAEYENVVFAATARLTAEQAGNSLDGFAGRPYSNALQPEITGTGYAMEQADFQRLLQELGCAQEPSPSQEATTELCCIVVIDPAAG